MKNVILSMFLVLGVSGQAMAQFVSLKQDAPATEGEIRVGSEFVYRGVSTSPDQDATVGLDFRVNNVGLPGLFVTSKFDAYRVQPIEDATQVRSDLGVRVGLVLADVLDVELSVHRVHNPNFRAPSYNEPRVRIGYDIFYAKFEYNEKNGNYYTAVGVDYPVTFVDGLTVGALASGIDFDSTDKFRFNNAEVYARYNVWGDLDLIGAYSYGGKDALGFDRKNEAWVTAAYRF